MATSLEVNEEKAPKGTHGQQTAPVAVDALGEYQPLPVTTSLAGTDAAHLWIAYRQAKLDSDAAWKVYEAAAEAAAVTPAPAYLSARNAAEGAFSAYKASADYARYLLERWHEARGSK